ncbi:hypothetical protein T484DRAFT_1886947 [Baffinella frigidus]|nr:hypothetical protein T484DRAFT_1886947 [Cryptophyta sp. CCMP2293]
MTVVSCIRDVALRHPAAPALAWLPATSLNGADTGVQQLSYKEVWSSAEGMADALRKLAPVEAAGGASVAVLVDEGTALPLLMLAILVARMVILPLDPDDPTDRLARALKDARPRIIVAKDEAQRSAATRAAAVSGCVLPFRGGPG